MKTIIDDQVTKYDGAGYKFHSPGISEHAGYFNIVGTPNPEAFFINSKDMKNFQWITGLMTSWSRLLQAGVPIENIINDAKDTFQPGGSYFIEDDMLKGQQVHSVVHHLGLILEQHIKQMLITRIVNILNNSSIHR